jgi:DNA-directed RNA polymerase subunit RPC12/RpoP
MPYVMKIVIVILLVIIALVMQNWLIRFYDYQCENCGTRFNLPAWQAVFSVHMLGKKYVKCPKCRKWSWVSPISKA